MNPFIRAVGAVGAILLSVPCATAQEAFPTSPVSIIVPYPAGGGADAFARVIANYMKDTLGQPVIVQNKAGASGAVGAAYVARSKPDGYNIFFGTGVALAVNPHLYNELPYDPVADFSPVVHAAFLPSYLVVNPDLPATNVTELVEYLKANPDTVNYASAGNGTPAHLGAELFKRGAGVQAAHIPYAGGAAALTDLMAGRVTFMFAYMSEVQAHLDSGQLRAIGITTKERSPLAPEIPTLAESGIADYELIGLYGFLVPHGTPADRIETLNHAFNDAFENSEVRDRMTAIGVDLRGGAPEALSELMVSESEKWGAVIRDAGITNE